MHLLPLPPLLLPSLLLLSHLPAPAAGVAQVMFVRVSSLLLAQRVPSAVRAAHYTSWAAGAVANDAALPAANASGRVLGECTSAHQPDN
jgi:hypothetical protein